MEWIIGILIVIFVIKFFTKDKYIIVADLSAYHGVSAKLRQLNKYHVIYYYDIKKLKEYCKKHNIQVMICESNKSENRAVIVTDKIPKEFYEEYNKEDK